MGIIMMVAGSKQYLVIIKFPQPISEVSYQLSHITTTHLLECHGEIDDLQHVMGGVVHTP